MLEALPCCVHPLVCFFVSSKGVGVGGEDPHGLSSPPLEDMYRCTDVRFLCCCESLCVIRFRTDIGIEAERRA